MQDPVFDRMHLREYAIYGGIAGLLYVIPVWYFLHTATYQASGILYIGCILFMFVILIYSIRLTRRRSDYQSAWRMIVAGHLAVLVGILISVVLSIILCFVYIPGFVNGNKAPTESSIDNTGAIQIIFLTATVANFGVGAFISLLCSYVIKPNQTNDETPEVLQDSETIEPSSNVVHHPNITH
jgi:hypothetical protein